jgi:hypothetical protein
MKASKLIGKEARIKSNIDSWAAGEWGVVTGYDGEYYYISLYNGDDELVFERSEFIVKRS